jgi:hypothetical protein
MPNFLIIRGDKVQNVIVADSLEIATALTKEGNEVIEATGSEPWINWTRSGGTWIKPEPVIPPAPTE